MIDDYIVLLESFDWFFEMSADHKEYRKGRDTLHVLNKMQKQVDPTGKIWMGIRPNSRFAPYPINYEVINEN